MAPMQGSPAFPPPRLLAELSSPAEVVAVVGPRGSGVTPLLREWLTAHDDAVGIPSWKVATLPDEALRGTLVIDDAERLEPQDWDRLGAHLGVGSELRLRLGLVSEASLPSSWHVEVVRELSFTASELRQHVATSGSRTDVAALFIATRGHARSVRAILESGVTRIERFDGVLAELDRDVLDASWADAAVPEVITRELLVELGGDGEAFDRAVRDGALARVAGAPQSVLMIPPPLRAATRAAFPRTADERRAIRERVALSLLDEGAWLEAVIEAVAAGRLDLVDRALKNGGMPFLRAHGTAIVWALHGTSAPSLARWPVIAMAKALVLNAHRGHSLRAAELMGVALVGIGTARKASPDRPILRTIESVARRLIGIGDGGVAAATAAARMLDELPPAELESIGGLIGDLHVHAGISLFYGGHFADARAQFEWARSRASRGGVELMAAGCEALLLAVEGDMHEAGRLVDATWERNWPSELADDYAGSMLRIADALVAIEGGDIARAEEAIEPVRAHIDTIEHWPLLAWVDALIDLRRGEAAEGLERLRLLRRRRGTGPRQTTLAARALDLSAITLELASGDVVAARSLRARPTDGSWTRLLAARVALAGGENERALQLVGGVETCTPRDRLERCVIESVLLARMGSPREAEIVAARARALANSAGLSTSFDLLRGADATLFGIEAAPLPSVAETPVVPRLTERERVVLRELVTGSRIDDIAARLHVSVNTVKSQCRALYRKLEARSREEAIARAIAYGLLDAPERPMRAITGTDASTHSDARPNRTA
ncbi:hypothetical protein GCM10011490_22310 [Pseudoclavibacter endophyticus]|uniref:Response regulator transcription factor n=1 Tax=Pseudoclavibacter endophyticus TaxID=1778590 RepID=A0A6H9WND0_9MICO|nr:LuxR C-terminal-related transcriptional regulator [Pseudoclavibacter endophyticus]KAB1648268.1 response regulator transcription factor [Pseudoclavibacter endophyticus]GGA71183.1 hypothetical protein GCM10011490_22310 [Pseudoclavibacter endophyticus]